MVNNMQQVLFQDIYSKLVDGSGSDRPKTLLSDLADIICSLIGDERNNLFYFSMPIWDYLNNRWDKNLVVRINSDNEENNDVKSDWNNWITENNNKIGESTYKTFFEQAGKKFSFIEFVTQHVKDISPLFTIEYSDTDKEITIDDKKTKLSCPEDVGLDLYENKFIEQTMKLLTKNNSEQHEEKGKKLNEFRVFLSEYKVFFPTLKYIYLVSSRLFEQDNGAHIGSGGVILVCKDAISETTLQQIAVLTNLCYRELGGKNWAERCRKESIKSAIAAIMSRNMSHNLGSHYLYYTKSQLMALADEFEEKGPEIRGAAKVLGYMQARMDYLATIVAGEKYPYGSVYFKGQMFDELTIDDFSKRHFKDEIEGNGKNRKFKRTTNYLLQNLILSENFTREGIFDDNLQTSKCNTLNDNQSKPIFARKFRRRNGESVQTVIQNELASPNSFSVLKGNGVHNRIIRLQLLIKESALSGLSKNERVFTGLLENEDKERLVKLGISKICIALPGGIMSIHAFYNVVENLIRNSAKYRKEDFNDKDLVFTIAIDELKEKTIKTQTEGMTKEKHLPARYRFIIYDNKSNANTKVNVLDEKGNNNEKPLIDVMNEKLSCVKILNKNNELDKCDKGLKEMLFSTIWMRAYTYEEAKNSSTGKAKDLSDILLEIDSKNGADKKDEIREHGFEYVAVDKDGELTSNKSIDANLGICFELPKYKTVEYIGEICSEDELIRKGLDNFRDIVCVKPGSKMTVSRKDGGPDYELEKVFTRLYEKEINNQSEVEIFKSILDNRFDNIINKVKISIEKEEKGFCKKTGILFVTHLGLDSGQKSVHLKKMKSHLYSEAVSGENFTKTIQDILLSGMDHNCVFNKETEYFALKVKEAALTRITLIDERFYKDMIDHSTMPKDENPLSRDFVLKCKNIRVLTLNDMDNNNHLRESIVFSNDHELIENAFVGNKFKDEKDNTHFLSIHLGMVEKIVKDEQWCKVFSLNGKDIGERAKQLLEKMKILFRSNKKDSNKNEVFISIHSGRGNFSKELEESLKDYPFISVSALDAALSNCKFLLAQLFYNTVYIGKGLANESN